MTAIFILKLFKGFFLSDIEVHLVSKHTVKCWHDFNDSTSYQ